MTMQPGHSDEIREKNIKEMVDAGHDPKHAVAAAYANQRKYRKMALGGMVHKDEMSPEAMEDDMNEESERGIFEMQEASHSLDGPDDMPEDHQKLASALSRSEDMASGNGAVSSDIDPEETVALPESYFAEEARKALEAKKKKQALAA